MTAPSKKKLTDRTIKALKPAEPGQRYIVKDTLVPGLGVRVTDKGALTFVLHARYPGSRNPTRRSLGLYGDLTLEAARDKARAWRTMLRNGIDPLVAEEEARLEAQRCEASTFAAVAEAFIAHIKRQRQRKAAAVERELRTEFVARWADRQITSIASQDVVAVIDAAIERGAAYQAHNLLGDIRRLFNWALARDAYGLSGSPCDRLKPKQLIGTRAMRTRILTDDELRAFWRATSALGYPYGPLFRLLAVTIQRKGEVANASRGELDVAQALWTIPAARMKMDAPHVVPLPTMAVEIFKALPSFTKGDYLFTTTFGAKPVAGFSKAKARLDKLMLKELREAADARSENPLRVHLSPWVLHDLRRTGRTGLSALPISELVRELVIAHAKPGLHKVYDQYAYLDEKREALERWAAKLRDIVEPPPANVVSLKVGSG